jgi:NADP-dependent 3-hydroxy acid dehydrogenase YdfG
MTAARSVAPVTGTSPGIGKGRDALLAAAGLSVLRRIVPASSTG